MGRIKSIELFNFKSYKGYHQVELGECHFSSIIGPNGSGKSNMMDAISFVLGIRSSSLRSHNLKDLIYRGRILSNPSEGTDNNFSSNSDPQTAHVMLLYQKEDGTFLRLKRAITSKGSSEYSIDAKAVNSNKYSDVLKKENVLIKARNFLVFQGDVESVASQTPKDLTNLIEQLSGSDEHKDEYDRAAAELETAKQASNEAVSKRRSHMTDVKQYQVQKNEIDVYNAKLEDKNNTIVLKALWKLYHLDERKGRKLADVKRESDNVDQLSLEVEEIQTTIYTANMETGAANRDFKRAERAVKRKQRNIEDTQTELLPVQEKITITERNLQRHRERFEEADSNCKRQQKEVERYEKDLELARRSLEQFETKFAEKSKTVTGLEISKEDTQQYEKLKADLNIKTAKSRLDLSRLSREKKTSQDKLDKIIAQRDVLQTRERRLANELEDLTMRQENIQLSIRHATDELRQKYDQYNSLKAQHQQRAAKEEELNGKLQECLSSLLECNSSRRESEKDSQLREAIENLKRNVPGVKGRVYELCKPKEAKYETAMSTVLGRHINYVVVDSSKTAQACIEFLKEQRSGNCYFIPMNDIKTVPTNNSYKGFTDSILAIQTIDYKREFGNVFQYICENTLVCDDLATAKRIKYNKGIDTKVVTLNGDVVHKSGAMSGGKVDNSGSKWEEAKVHKLNKLKDRLMSELGDLAKLRRNDEEETMRAAISGLEILLKGYQDQSTEVARSIRSLNSEIPIIQKSISDIEPQLSELTKGIKDIANMTTKIDLDVQKVEQIIFQEFCARLNLPNIREFERAKSSLMEELSRETARLSKHISVVSSELQFQRDRLQEFTARRNLLTKNINKENYLLDQLHAERKALQDTYDKQVKELEVLNTELEQAAELRENVLKDVEEVHKKAEEINRSLKSARRKLTTAEEEVDKILANRSILLKNCKLEMIELPLTDQSQPMSSISLDIANDDTGDVGIIPDYTKLPKSLQRNAQQTVEEELEEKIRSLSVELEKMIVNSRAGERLAEAQLLLRESSEEANRCRAALEEADARFKNVEKTRRSKFLAAFNHISANIDDIYKELSSVKHFTGSAELNLESSEDPPYLSGINYTVTPPTKRFFKMNQLSGGEKTMAAMALLFAIHSFHPSPFFVLDEIDAALDNANVIRLARYIRNHARPGFQFIVISLKTGFFENSDALVGIYRDTDDNTSKALTLDLKPYEQTV